MELKLKTYHPQIQIDRVLQKNSWLKCQFYVNRVWVVPHFCWNQCHKPVSCLAKVGMTSGGLNYCYDTIVLTIL